MTDKHNPDKVMAGMLKRKGVWSPPAKGEACPDAAALAAYFERSLTADETSLCETHFAACARCQEQLAALVRSEPASQVKSAEEKKPAFSWFWDWRFLAPVGAAVLAFAFFISFETMGPRTRSTGGGELVAKREATTPAPAATGQQRSAESASAKKLDKGPAASDEFASKNAVAAADRSRADLSLKDKMAAKSPATASGAAAVPVPAKPAEKENQITAAGGHLAPAPIPPQGVTVVAQDQAARAQQKIADADRIQALQKQEGAVVVAESKEQPAAAPSTRQLKEQQVPAGKQEAATSEKASSLSRFALSGAPKSPGKFINAPGEFIVTTPNPKVLWRFGASGLIERSGDAGKTWDRQKSSVREAFLSGSAPSDTICWVGGNNGILLRTMDAGENWEIIPSPLQNDIVVVKARNQFFVTVVDADGRTFETSNAGRLWRTP